ncbi:MAG: hypothetical protein Q7R47_06815 [Candidatus Diapherotrites archaeon]|nr:hypothetical protein [Candidatus Diapherotrites archaeon]
MDNKIYVTRENKERVATEDEIKRFEKSALADFAKGKDVYLIEAFPNKFFGYATKIRLERVMIGISTLSDESNSHLFKVVATGSIYE